jgi:diaminopimelate decarboxylase
MSAHATSRTKALLELFPPGTERDSSGRLLVGGCDLEELGERFGTPLYLVDETALRSQARRFRHALEARRARSRVLFASKAVPCAPGLGALASEGLGFDVAGGARRRGRPGACRPARQCEDGG